MSCIGETQNHKVGHMKGGPSKEQRNRFLLFNEMNQTFFGVFVYLFKGDLHSALVEAPYGVYMCDLDLYIRR